MYQQMGLVSSTARSGVQCGVMQVKYGIAGSRANG